MQVVHADWGVNPSKRWFASARVDPATGWSASPARQVPNQQQLRQAIPDAAEAEPLVVGFDFPIGIPRAYAQAAGVEHFVDLLPGLGSREWSDFFEVADDPPDISLRRPFYPRTAGRKGQHRRAHLTDALGLPMASLLRRCEQQQPHRNAACSLFWTLGGNQVGKAALSGWRVLQQQPCAELRIWPFDGDLHDLLVAPGIVVAETYPTEFYAHLGLPSVIGKRKQDNRSAASGDLLRAAERLQVALHPDLREQIVSGFGPAPSGEDAFDAVVGVLGMINVIAGTRPPGEPRDDPHVLQVEGWILGQAANPSP